VKAKQYLEELCKEFDAAGIKSASFKATWIICHTLAIKPTELELKNPLLTEEQLARLDLYKTALLSGKPLQYVLGETDFRGHLFTCDERALIPRFETEELVQLALDLPDFWDSSRKLLDVGTGTSCVISSLALEKPGHEYCAVDISEQALSLARENIRFHGLEISLQLSDLLEDVEGTYDLIVSNPPYIKKEEISGLDNEIRSYEPHTALDGGNDGLDLIRKLLEQSTTYLKPAGWILLEIGETQGTLVEEYARSYKYTQAIIESDFKGKPRFFKAQKA